MGGNYRKIENKQKIQDWMAIKREKKNRKIIQVKIGFYVVKNKTKQNKKSRNTKNIKLIIKKERNQYVKKKKVLRKSFSRTKNNEKKERII